MSQSKKEKTKVEIVGEFHTDPELINSIFEPVRRCPQHLVYKRLNVAINSLAELGVFEDIHAAHAETGLRIYVRETENNSFRPLFNHLRNSIGQLQLSSMIYPNQGTKTEIAFDIKNFLSKRMGEELRLVASTSNGERNYSGSFSMPLVNKDGTLSRLKASLYGDNYYIGAQQHPLVKHVGELVYSRGRNSLAYKCAFNHLQRSEKSPPILDSVESSGHYVTSSLSHTFSKEGRDNQLFPMSGSFFQISTELAGLGGDAAFLKNEVNAQKHFPLPLGASFGVDAKVGNISGLGRGVPSFERFFLGRELEPFRGFANRSIGPVSRNQHIGGDFFATLRAHLTIPSFTETLDWLYLTFFVSQGNLIGKDSNTSAINQTRNFCSTLRGAAGVGIAAKSTMGRFEVGYSFPLQHESSDRKQGIYFSLQF